MKSSLLALAMALNSGPALAEQFALLVHETPEQLALRADPGAVEIRSAISAAGM